MWTADKTPSSQTLQINQMKQIRQTDCKLPTAPLGHQLASPFLRLSSASCSLFLPTPIRNTPLQSSPQKTLRPQPLHRILQDQTHYSLNLFLGVMRVNHHPHAIRSLRDRGKMHRVHPEIAPAQVVC